MAVKALRRIQLGYESGAAGTAVPATTIWRGTGVGRDTRELVFPEEDVGLLVPPTRVYTPRLGAEVVMNDVEATFEQLPYIFEAGVESETGTQDGAGTDYIYTYNLATGTRNTFKTYTVEYGDDHDAWEMDYSFVREFSLKGAAGEAVMMSATWQGRQENDASFTGSLSLPAIDEILMGTGALYIDNTSTYPATTQKSNTFISFDLSCKTGRQAVPTADRRDFAFAEQVKPELTLQITFEHDASATTERTAWKAETERAIRIRFQHPTQVTTPGTTYTYKSLIIDLCGHWETFDALDDRDGNDIVTGTFRVGYSSTATATGRFIVVNELSALP